jgi:hypothetical protein
MSRRRFYLTIVLLLVGIALAASDVGAMLGFLVGFGIAMYGGFLGMLVQAGAALAGIELAWSGIPAILLPATLVLVGAVVLWYMVVGLRGWLRGDEPIALRSFAVAATAGVLPVMAWLSLLSLERNWP